MSFVVALSNFRGQGAQPVGTHRGIGLYDVYDLAGNVAEWCLNATDLGRRSFQGGAWDTPEYMFGVVDSDSPLARRQKHGFRCAKYSQPVPSEALRAIANPRGRNVEAEPRASTEEIEAAKRHYLYDAELPLNDTNLVQSDVDEHRKIK